MPAPPVIADLVERFGQQSDAYKSGQYNEAQLRKEFVDPMFKALGWDMENISGYAEAYKDVIHEDAIKIGGATKAPDYCFRIGGTRKFFLEAKKPSVDIKSDAHPAFQLRRYAWSAKLPLSVLTDFEEFAAYDCRVKPALSDAAATARVLYLQFGEYISRWDEIEKIFSRESILKGSFDKFAESTKAKRGTAEVDDAFLDEIEKWRADLAANLALRNPALSQRDLNFAVQRTIDRIVFLRICEDRRIEVYGRLMALLNGEHTYARLNRLFREADERYNSGLFHFQKEKDRVEPPDDLTPGLEIDDAVLKKIIRRLYYPESPYEFSVLPADILGQVYEQFLGKVIRLTEGHRAKIEDKPEVKKAGGVYYTPTYIVDYIVKNTVGKLLENKTPRHAAKLRILDPACGSGSFLIGAYQYLLDWHRDWFASHDAKKSATGRNPVLYQAPGGEWKLTTTERKRILLQNIFGVDIDAQAVETTKLSLLLKVLEGESEQTLATQLRFYHERALPDLGRNIKCGNSLIGPDFYQQQEMQFLDEEERYRINVFDWNKEFPEIMKVDGFDAVIGNPPYVRMELFKEIKTYLARHYESHDERTDLYVYFVERSLELLRRGGLYGVIVSNKWVRSKYGEKLRIVVEKNGTIESIIDFGELPVFQKAATFPAIFIVRGGGSEADYTFSLTQGMDRDTFNAIRSGITLLVRIEQEKRNVISSSALRGKVWKLNVGQIEDLLQRLRSVGPSLLEYSGGKIRYGIKTGLVEAFVIDSETKRRLLRESPAAERMIRPYVIGDDVRKYHIRKTNRFLIYTFHDIDMRGCASVLRHLERFKAKLEKRATEQEWYELQQPQHRYVPDYESPKIIYPDIAKESRFAFDDAKMYPADTTFVIPLADLYLLGVLNSKLAFFYFSHVCPVLGDVRHGGRLRMKLNYVQEFPVKLGGAANQDRHDRMVSLVEQMLELHKQLAAAKTDHARTNIERQIDATDAQIDKLVYELYGLSEDEIKIVDGTAI